MNRQQCLEIGSQLKNVVTKMGLRIEGCKSRYDSQTMRITIDLADSLEKSPAVIDVVDYHVKSGLAPRGTQVVCGGRWFTILSMRRTKYLAEGQDGRTYTLRPQGCSLVEEE